VVLTNMDGEHWTELPVRTWLRHCRKNGHLRPAILRFAWMGRIFTLETGGPGGAAFCVARPRPDMVRLAETPIISGTASSGIFSISAMRGHRCGRRGLSGSARGRTRMRRSPGWRENWELATQLPGGYRSAVGRYDGGYVTVGPTGAETSGDGLRWNSIGKVNFNAYAVSLLGNAGWAVGPHGIGRSFWIRRST